MLSILFLRANLSPKFANNKMENTSINVPAQIAMQPALTMNPEHCVNERAEAVAWEVDRFLQNRAEVAGLSACKVRSVYVQHCIGDNLYFSKLKRPVQVNLNNQAGDGPLIQMGKVSLPSLVSGAEPTAIRTPPALLHLVTTVDFPHKQKVVNMAPVAPYRNPTVPPQKLPTLLTGRHEKKNCAKGQSTVSGNSNFRKQGSVARNVALGSAVRQKTVKPAVQPAAATENSYSCDIEAALNGNLSDEDLWDDDDSKTKTKEMDKKALVEAAKVMSHQQRSDKSSIIDCAIRSQISTVSHVDNFNASWATKYEFQHDPPNKCILQVVNVCSTRLFFTKVVLENGESEHQFDETRWSNLPTLTKKHYRSGLPCIFRQLDGWYRALIVSWRSCNNTVSVFLVDSGVSVTVVERTPSRLKPLLKVDAVPPKAIACCLTATPLATIKVSNSEIRDVLRTGSLFTAQFQERSARSWKFPGMKLWPIQHFEPDQEMFKGVTWAQMCVCNKQSAKDKRNNAQKSESEASTLKNGINANQGTAADVQSVNLSLPEMSPSKSKHIADWIVGNPPEITEPAPPQSIDHNEANPMPIELKEPKIQILSRTSPIAKLAASKSSAAVFSSDAANSQVWAELGNDNLRKIPQMLGLSGFGAGMGVPITEENERTVRQIASPADHLHMLPNQAAHNNSTNISSNMDEKTEDIKGMAEQKEILDEKTAIEAETWDSFD